MNSPITRNISILLLTLLTVITANSQTTMEEYNYVTKGWKNHLEDGSDVKKGYEMKQIKGFRFLASDSVTYHSFELYTFKRVEKVGARTVAYMVAYKVNDGPLVDYVCVPHPKSSDQVKDLFFHALNDPYYVYGSSGIGIETERLRGITFLLATALTW